MNDQSLTSLVEQLNTADQNQIDDICRLIRDQLAGPAGLEFLFSEEAKPLLSKGLLAPNEELQKLTLEQMLRLAHTPEGVQFLIKEQYLTAVIQKLRGNLATFEPSNKVLLAVAKSGHPAAIQGLFADKNMELLEAMVSGDQEIIKFRALELAARLSAVSVECLERVRLFLDRIIDLMRVDDVLQQLNVVQLVEGIADSKQGAEYLLQCGILTHLTGLLSGDDPMASLLVPAILQLFGSLVKKEHADYKATISPAVHEAVHKFLNGDDPACEEAAIVAVGALGHNSQGLSSLLNEHSKLVKDWLYYSSTANTASRITFLHSLADLLGLTQQAANLFNELTEKSIVQTLIKLLEQPFEDQRYAVFSVIRSLASHPWGAQSLLEFPGVYEFLVNRGTEATKPGHEWKYSIIEVLVRSDAAETTKRVLGDMRFFEFNRYLREGVFYVTGEHRVLIAAKSGF